MSVFSAGTRGHYHESLLNSSHPKKYLPNFSNQKNPATENFKPFDHPRHLGDDPRHLGVAANPPTRPPPPKHPPGVWIISNFEKPKIARNRDSSTVLYCAVLCCNTTCIHWRHVHCTCTDQHFYNWKCMWSVSQTNCHEIMKYEIVFCWIFFMYILYICSFLPHCFFLVISWERNGKAG